jgi:hypothetical protein
VSAATCVVLVETLSVNQELALLVLQDDPLGALGAHKLLRAVHAGEAAARVCHVSCQCYAVSQYSWCRVAQYMHPAHCYVGPTRSKQCCYCCCCCLQASCSTLTWQAAAS